MKGKTASDKPSSAVAWLAPLLLAPLLAGLSYGLMLLLISPPAWANVAGSGAQTVPGETAVANATLTSQPTTVPVVGFSRSNPHPAGSTVSLDYWDVSVISQPIRGEAAWKMLQEANMFNDPPAKGQEYLLLQMRLIHHHDTTDEETLSLHVTGSENIVHFSYDNGQVPPEPVLQTSLPGPEKSQGWNAYTLTEGEGNLVLIIDDLSNYEEPAQYLALTDESPAPIPADELSSIQRTDVGAARQSPAGLEDITTSAEWQMQVLEVIRGEAAWKLAYETNQFNEPPPAGFEYVLVRARVRYLGLSEEPQLLTEYSNFAALAGNGEAYERPSLVTPEPELSGMLFPGGELTGWLAFQVAADDTAPLLKFTPYAKGDEEAEVRYFLLGGYGR